MKIYTKVSIGILTVTFIFVLAGLIRVRAATAVNLGTADNFAVLGGSTVTNTGSSVINGDLGLSPGTSITGFPPGTLNGTQHATDTTASGAQTDLTTAYNNAAGQTPVSTVPTELGGTTKTAGTYDSSAGTFGITGTLTLDAQANPDAVFIFKMASTLTTASDSKVVLTNGAQACNVFWQVGSSATLGTNSTFKGNILALTSATLTTGANVEGRVLARNGAVTLDTNTITKATCALPPTVPAVPATVPDTATTTPTTPATSTTPGSSSTSVLPLPLINITKIPTPLALPAGPGSVTYDYTVINAGTVAMSNIKVTDNKCSDVSYVSGDTNGDSKLDTSETWKYHCTTTISQTTTDTATATGEGNGSTATDTANATVVVGASKAAPLVHILKKPNLFVLPSAGGTITYTYTVTNPGTEPLSDVSVTDNKCTGLPGRVVGHPGDINKNDLLESNETWTFTCVSKLTKSTTNIGTAEGHANGLTAIDFSPATVVVSGPGLPGMGFPPKDNSNPWKIIVLSGIVLLASASLINVLRKRTNQLYHLACSFVESIQCVKFKGEKLYQ